MITKKKNLPKKWDVVDSIKYNKERTKAQIVFNTGSSILVDLDPSEFMRGTNESVQVINEPKMLVKPQVKRQLSMAEQDQDYKNRAILALQAMGGDVPVTESTVMKKPLSATLKEAESLIPEIPDFKELAERAIRRSEEISSRIADELKPKTPLPK